MAQTRQLAAIMFTDIVGYTALMGQDEQKAFEVLVQNRQIQKPLIERYRGRWIKEIGDGVLAIFTTVKDAVQCAVDIQKACSRNHQFKLRIGIHLGDVVLEQDDVFGDGVNIASRIQSLAPVGGIWVSEPVQKIVSNNKEIRTRYIQEALLKNVKEPEKIYEVLIEGGDKSNQHTSEHEALPDDMLKSIAVLPFVNMSNDPEQEYFCDGISEEIINALAQLNKLRVVARTSVFAFKGKNLDVRDIGKALDVQTLLEGSVRKVNSHVRITTKLISVTDGSNLWANRYDRELADIFSIQDDIAENVATALQGVLSARQKAAIRRPETMIEAYEYFLKGRQLLHQMNFSEAKSFFEKAIENDPEYAPAYAGLSDVHSFSFEWEGAREEDLSQAEINSEMAVALAPDSSESHTSRGFALSLSKKYDEAEKEFKKAIELNANSYEAYYLYGRCCFSRGQIEQSAELFRKASEARREDYQSLLLLSQSLKVLGREEATQVLYEGVNRVKKQLALNPADGRALSLGAGNLLETGEREEALRWINKALDLYPEDTGVLVNAACLFAKDGDKEKALDLLEKLFGKGFGKREWIEYDPDYDNLRQEPRFKALLNKLK